MKNVIVAQSGGPTSAINASLAGVIDCAMKNERIGKVYCGLNGIEGILKETIVEAGEFIKSDEDIKALKQTPSSFLGSCRYKLGKSGGSEDYAKVFEILEKYNIGYFFYIGGNDSMDTIKQLSEYAQTIGSDIRFMGVPKTIDNDLAMTDHTPGYGSAAKWIATTMAEIRYDCAVYLTKAVTIVEIMGRNAGWLTAASALAGVCGKAPDYIYLPERDFCADKFIDDINRLFAQGKNDIVIAVSEGIRYKDGKYVADSGKKDVFGNPLLCGAGKELEGLVRAKIGCKVRSIELNLPQRCAGHLASQTDLDESFKVGAAAVNGALAGETGKMMVFVRKSSSPYAVSVESRDIGAIANIEKTVPDEFINDDGNFVTDEFVSYALPLIQGEVKTVFVNGLPQYKTL